MPRIDPNHWQNAAVEVDYLWRLWCTESSPIAQADLLVRLNNAMSDLRTFIPRFDSDTGTLPWERSDNDA